MLLVIVLLIVGSILAYISHSNLMPVTVNLGPYVFANIPLFYVMVASLLSGLVLSYVFYLVHSITDSFIIRSKEHQIKKNKEEVLELTKRVHQLELENEKLKHAPAEPSDRNAL